MARLRPHNRYVAGALRKAGLATLLIDLLTPEEEEADLRTRRLRFDIGLLADGLAGATDWLAQEPDTQDLRIGYFGASTGAGAALATAAKRPDALGAVVSRGGRPDLAGEALSSVVASTLLIVGGEERVYAWHYGGGNRTGVCFLVSPSAGSDERWGGGKWVMMTLHVTKSPPVGIWVSTTRRLRGPAR